MSAYLEEWNRLEELNEKRLYDTTCVDEDCGRPIAWDDCATCAQCGGPLCWGCKRDHERDCWDMFEAQEAGRPEDPYPPDEPRGEG